MGRKPITTKRPNITKRTRQRGDQKLTTYDAYVRGPGGYREYLRTYDNREEAIAAAIKFIETGEKPPSLKTGPLRGTRYLRRKSPSRSNHPKANQTRHSANPGRSARPSEDRLEMMRRVFYQRLAQ